MSTLAMDREGADGAASRVLPATELEISLHETGRATLVLLRGEINIDSSPALRNHLLAALQNPETKALIVDMTDISFIDASGIATLVEALKIARTRQKNFCLKGLEGRVLRLFEVSGLLHLFEASGCRDAGTEAKVP